MWFIGRSILAYLTQDNIKEKERIKLTKKVNLIKLEINSLKDEELIDYLLHKNIPNEIKELICEKLKSLKESIWSTENKRYELITNIYKEKRNFTKEQLKLDFYPREFKSIIIDNIYKDSTINLVSSNTIPLNIKKIIIDIKLSRNDAIKLLGSNISDNIKDYIIDNNINEESDISNCIEDRNISDELKFI